MSMPSAVVGGMPDKTEAARKTRQATGTVVFCRPIPFLVDERKKQQ
jgi:hypothetical protein